MGKVLIVEDDPLIAKVYSTRLTADKHEVFIANNGEDGLKTAREKIPDLIVLDIMMPKMSGLEVLAELKKVHDTAKIPVLVYSNLARDEEIQEAKKLGATEFIAKVNLTSQQLVTKIEGYLKK
jgi:CheY-like chemotaxis protein